MIMFWLYVTAHVICTAAIAVSFSVLAVTAWQAFRPIVRTVFCGGRHE